MYTDTLSFWLGAEASAWLLSDIGGIWKENEVIGIEQLY